MAWRHLVLLAYLGPETVIPLLSVIAGAVGVVLSFGKTARAWVAAPFKRLWKRFRHR